MKSIKGKITALIFALLFIVFGGYLTTAESKQTKELVIGTVQPYSGAYGALCLGMKIATNIAVEDINKAGGVVIGGERYTLKVVHYDDESNPTKAVALTERAINEDGAQIIYGSSFSACTLAMLDVTKRAKRLQLNTSGHPDITRQGHPYVLRGVPPLGGYLRSWPYADYIVNELGLKNVVIIHARSDYGVAQRSTYEEAIKGVGGNLIETLSHASGETDLQPLLTKVKAVRNADAVLWTDPGKMGMFLKQAAEAGLKPGKKPRLLGEGAMICPELFEASGGPQNIEGAVVLNVPSPKDIGTSKALEFNRKFKDITKNDADGITAVYYDATFMILDAMKKAGSITDTDAIRAAIPDSPKNLSRSIVYPPSFYTKEGDLNVAFAVFKLKDGKPVLLKILKPYVPRKKR